MFVYICVFRSLVSFTCAVAFQMVNILIFTSPYWVTAANSCVENKNNCTSFELIVTKAGANLELVTVSGCGTKQEISTSNSWFHYRKLQASPTSSFLHNNLNKSNTNTAFIFYSIQWWLVMKSEITVHIAQTRLWLLVPSFVMATTNISMDSLWNKCVS